MAQCIEARRKATTEAVRERCSVQCGGDRDGCLSRCRAAAPPDISETECRFAFCRAQGADRGGAVEHGGLCLLSDQSCDYGPDAPKHGTRCQEGLSCVVRSAGDAVDTASASVDGYEESGWQLSAASASASDGASSAGVLLFMQNCGRRS